jgi:putative cell wall-binding protein
VVVLAMVALVGSAPVASGQPREHEQYEGVFAVEAQSPAQLSATVVRDRFKDASADRVVVATSAKFPDVLSGGPLAGVIDAPIFFTVGDAAQGSDRLPFEVEQQIERVATGSTTAVILGGPVAVSDEVEQRLSELDGVAGTRRFAGNARIGTATEVADSLVAETSTAQVLVARAYGGSDPYADALAGGSYGAGNGAPVVLTATNQLSRGTRDWIAAHPELDYTILGGPVAVSEQVKASIDDLADGEVTRVAGPTRTETALEIARSRQLWDRSQPCNGLFTVANGQSFPAALLAAQFESPTLLSVNTDASKALDYLERAGGGCQPELLALSAGDIPLGPITDSAADRLDRGAPIGSRSRPFPVGKVVPLEDQWTLEVISSEPNANDEVADENQFNEPPENGQQYFMARVRVTYKGEGSDSFDPSRLRSVGASDIVYTTFEDDCGVIPDPLRSQETFSGGSRTGNVCWEINRSDVASLVMFDDGPFDAGERRYRPFFALGQ